MSEFEDDSGICNESVKGGVYVAEFGIADASCVYGVKAGLSAVGEVLEVGVYREFIPNLLYHEPHRHIVLSYQSVSEMLLADIVQLISYPPAVLYLIHQHRVQAMFRSEGFPVVHAVFLYPGIGVGVSEKETEIRVHHFYVSLSTFAVHVACDVVETVQAVGLFFEFERVTEIGIEEELIHSE